jgi:competence protein ComEA
MDLKKKRIIVICLLVFICVAISIWQSRPTYLSEGTRTELETLCHEEQNDEKRTPAKICVYVSGAVKNPGLHHIAPGSRGKDAIAEAGGFVDNANKDRVNLAKKLKDGNHVNVPFLTDKQWKKIKQQEEGPFEQHSFGERKAPAGREGVIAKININQAAQTELEKLPGIGPSLAGRIISYRNTKPFKQIQDICEVPGIGTKKFLQIEQWLEV